VIDSSSNTPGHSAPERQSELVCSFCGKGRDEVRKLIAGPQVYICDECVDLCDDILEQEQEPLSTEDKASSTLCHLPTPIGELLPIPERSVRPVLRPYASPPKRRTAPSIRMRAQPNTPLERADACRRGEYLRTRAGRSAPSR
jgi:hypothetical protein